MSKVHELFDTPSYADVMANCADIVRRLQSQINVISSFCSRTGTEINLKKTKIIAFRNGGYLPENEHWTYNGEYIETVSSYKYMGILFTPKLIWTKTKQALAIQSQKSIISILKLKKTLVTLIIRNCLSYFTRWLHQFLLMVQRLGVLNMRIL